MLEGWIVIGQVALKMWWLWLPVVVLVVICETPLGKKVSDKIDKFM